MSSVGSPSTLSRAKPHVGSSGGAAGCRCWAITSVIHGHSRRTRCTARVRRSDWISGVSLPCGGRAPGQSAGSAFHPASNAHTGLAASPRRSISRRSRTTREKLSTSASTRRSSGPDQKP